MSTALPIAVLGSHRYEAGCEGKQGHVTESAASAAMKFYQGEGSLRTNDGIHPYKCDFCPDWHLGH